ncbi:MAG: preprotein translocase subunit SecE [Patescibacteria group bacterium]|nr:preprotein translocase subunit SecE [Patescibacteria group bacterium]
MFQFFSEVRTELSKVVWPTRAETVKYTLIVIVFSLIIAAILGAFDYGLLRLFEALISR